MEFNVIRNFLIFVSLFGFTFSDVSQFITPCYYSDPNVNTCIKSLFNNLRPFLANGIPELNLQPIEPLIVPQIQIINDNGNFRLNGKYKNVKISGSSGIYVTDVKSDLKNLRVDTKIQFPKLEIKGNFDIFGQALLLPIRAKGEFWLELTSITAIAKIFGKEVLRNGVPYAQIDRFYIDFGVKGAKIKVSDQVNPQLNEILNQFLNQNAILLVQETRAASSKAIAPLFKEMLQKIFDSQPLEKFFIKS